VTPVSELPPFSGLTVRCPKCTAVVEAAEYQPAFRRAKLPGREPGSSLEPMLAFEKAMEKLEKQYAERPGGAGEHMLRSCPVCRYKWTEQCADAEASAGGPPEAVTGR
jgi:hypothetical protein